MATKSTTSTKAKKTKGTVASAARTPVTAAKTGKAAKSTPKAAAKPVMPVKASKPISAKSPAKKSAPKSASAKPGATKAKSTPVKASASNTQQTVESFMTSTPQICRASDHLANAAAGMWTADCGSLPVLDNDAQLVGWITDRDIAMALAMQPVPASEIEVGHVMNGPVHTCTTQDRLSDAVATMTDKQVRRLAVLNDSGELVGVLSIADLIQAAKANATATAPAITDVFDALRGIVRPYEVSTTV